MSRELVRVGDAEPLWFEDTYGTTIPTGYEVRAYIIDAGVRKYDNGSAFTTTDAQLSGTFTTGVWIGSYTYPAYALGKEVFIRADVLGIPELAQDPHIDSRWVVQYLPDDVKSTVDAHEAASATRRTDEMSEHNAILAAIAQIAGAAEAFLYGPSAMSVPGSGTRTYKLRLLVRDLDTSPTALVDPDGQIVNLTGIDTQTGLPPAGITIPATMARTATGDYEASIIVSSSALEDRSIVFDASYTKNSEPNKAVFVTVTSDLNTQLGRVEADLAAHRAEVEPELYQIVQDTTTDLPAQITQARADIIAEVDTRESEASAATRAAADQAAHTATQNALAAARATLESAIAAVQTAIDEMDADLGETADTGGSSTTGTTDAKLNKALEDLQAILNSVTEGDIEVTGVETVP